MTIYPKNICNCTVATVFLGIRRKLSGVDKDINDCKTNVSEFSCRCPEIRSMLWPHRYREMGKCWNVLYSESAGGVCYLSQNILVLGLSRWLICRFDTMTYPSGHLRSYKIKRFFLIFLEKRDRTLGIIPMCFPLVDASTDMQHDELGLCVTSRNLDLRSNFKIDI